MAVRFDASVDYLRRTSNVPSAANFSACGWANRIVSTGFYSAIFSLENGGSNWLELSHNGTTLAIVHAGDIERTITTPALGTEFVWALTCNGTTTTLRIRERNTSTWTSVTGTYNAFTANAVYLANNSFGEYANARIWNVKVWDRVLTADELLVESFYERVMFPASLNFHWRLANTSDINDRSGNGRAATTGGTLASEAQSAALWVPQPYIIMPGAAAAGGDVTGTSAMAFTTAGSLTGTTSMAGTSAPAFSVTGTLTGSGALAGTTAPAFTTTAAITGSGALAATSAMAFTTTAAITGTGDLAGTSAAAFTTTATFTQDTLAATAAMAFSVTGALTGVGDLAGSSAMAFTPAATISGLGALAGTSSPAFSLTGDLTGLAAGDTSGAVEMLFTVTSALTGDGALSGQSSMAFTATATFTQEGSQPAGGGGGGGGRIWYQGQKPRGKRQTLGDLANRLIDETLAEELYRDIRAAGEGETVAKAVKPHAESRAAEPPPEAIDWDALARDAAAVGALLQTWRRIERQREIDEDDEDWLLM